MQAPGRRPARTLLLAVALALGASAALLPGSAAIRNRGISFDGGINAQVARTLAERHRYATTYRGLHDFDHRVQTGPTVIVPTAIAFRLFGVNATTAQLANVAYLALLFVLAVLLCWRLSGPMAAFLVVPVLLATPQLFRMGLGLYGEIPALAFLVGGLLLLHRSVANPAKWTPFLGGMTLGLAVLTKFQMVLPAAVVMAIFWIMGDRTGRTGFSRLTSVAGGLAVTLLPLEVIRFHVLSGPVWLQWWRTMLGRSLAQGTSFRMDNTVSGPTKPWVHLEVLSNSMHLSSVLVVFLVVLPPLLLAALIHARRRTQDAPDPAREVTLVALAGAALSLVLWWLLLSPTSHTWFRRVVDGVILLEMLATILVVDWSVRLWRRRGTSATGRTGWLIPTGIVLLAQVLTVLGWTRVPQLGLEVAPSPRRSATGAMVDVISSLPRDAAIYARGWYEAPVLAALTGRTFLDLDQFPIDRYRTPLENTYFIADDAMVSNEPDALQSVLRRAGLVLVACRGSNLLYQIARLCPYAPIPQPIGPGELLTVFRPREGFYPFCGGLVQQDGSAALGRSVAGVLLNRGGLPCLTVEIRPTRRAGSRPRITIRVDGRSVWEGPVEGGRAFSMAIPLTQPPPHAPRHSLVEISVVRTGPPPRFLLWDHTGGTFVLRSVGFTHGCGPLGEDREAW